MGAVGESRDQVKTSAELRATVNLNRQYRRITRLLSALGRMSRTRALAIAAAVILAIGVLDAVTGQIASFAVFYLVPVVLGAWLLGRRTGLWLAVAAGVVWSLADQVGLSALPRSPLLYWNDVTLLAVFMLAVLLTSALKTTWEYENGLLADVQAHLLPRTMPQLERCEVVGRWWPAGVVGGDYYDAIPLGEGRIVLCIADVSGKGFRAAMVMSNVQAAVRVLHDSHSPAQLVAHLNTLVMGNTRLGTFVTMFYCVLDTAAGTVTFANAGHNPPVLARRDGTFERLGEGGPVLGILPDAKYHEGQRSVGAGDRLVLFTDGLSEHGVAAGEELGEERVVRTVLAHRASGASQLCDALVDVAVAHAGSVFEDDLTLLVAAVS